MSFFFPVHAQYLEVHLRCEGQSDPFFHDNHRYEFNYFKWVGLCCPELAKSGFCLIRYLSMDFIWDRIL